MEDSAKAGWSFIFDGTNEPVENSFLHTTQYGCISSDPAANPYFKHFSNRAELSMVQDANSRETAKPQVPSIFSREDSKRMCVI